VFGESLPAGFWHGDARDTRPEADIGGAAPWTCAHALADLNEREAGARWGNGRPNPFDRQRPSPPRAGTVRHPTS
jgi:hypothetical protein